MTRIPRVMCALGLLVAGCRSAERSVPGRSARESPPVEPPPQRLDAIGSEAPGRGTIEPPGGAGADVALLGGGGPDASSIRVLGSDAGASADAAIVVPEGAAAGRRRR